MREAFWSRGWGTICLCAIFWPVLVLAQGIEVEMQHIQALVAAGDDERALRRYESLLEDVKGWQKGIVQYNIATVWLSKGDAAQALARYRSIPADEDSLPLLQQRLAANSALAKLMLVEKRLGQLTGQSASAAGAYSQAVIDLRDVLDAISVAEKSACALSHAEGGAECDPLPEIAEMRLVAKHALADLLESYFKYKLSHVTLQGGSAGLLIGLEAVLANVAFLHGLPDSEPLKPQYVDLILQQAESWRPLWDGLQAALQHSSDESSKQNQLARAFQRGSQAFMTGSRWLHQGEVAASQASFVASKGAVDELLQLVFGQADLKDTLQQLLILYDLVLLQEPLQELSLAVLVKAQQPLQPLVDAHGVERLQALYAAAVRDLGIGKGAVDALQLLQGRMFVLAANDAVKTMAHEIDGAVSASAISRLEQMVAAEQLALQFNLLKQFSEGKEAPLDGSGALLLRAQQQALALVAGFFKAAVAQQLEAFRAVAPQEGPDVRCQAFPWDTVIPLVAQGQQEAEKAQAILAGSLPLLAKAADGQAAAIQQWQAALTQLKAAKKQPSPQKQQDNKPQKAEKQQQVGAAAHEKARAQAAEGGAPKPTAAKTDVNSVLRFLQEMENDDRSRPEKTPPAGAQGQQTGAAQVQRPW